MSRYFLCLVSNLLELLLQLIFLIINHENREVLSFEVAACITNLLGSFTFVTSEHPDFDSGISEVLDALNDIILKHVFNSSNS
jgi:hypothetical protein